MKANPLGLFAILSITRLTVIRGKLLRNQKNGSWNRWETINQIARTQFNGSQHVNICCHHLLQADQSFGKHFVNYLLSYEKRDLYEITDKWQNVQAPCIKREWGGEREVQRWLQPIKYMNQGILVLWRYQFNTVTKTLS